jgi:hypothetical protein
MGELGAISAPCVKELLSSWTYCEHIMPISPKVLGGVDRSYLWGGKKLKTTFHSMHFQKKTDRLKKNAYIRSATLFLTPIVNM